MKLRTLKDASIQKDTRVLVRVDLNVPLKQGQLAPGADVRFKAQVPFLKDLIEKGARIILLTHLGRPKGKVVPSLRTAPLAKALSKRLHHPVSTVRDVVGPAAEQAVEHMRPGDVVLLENVRFYPGEEKNSTRFANQLARLGDVYVNNAFSVCHRQHASVHALAKKLPSCAGPLVQKEVDQLSVPLKAPFILILGGMKLETKMGLLHALAPKAKSILLGSGVAAALHAANTGSAFRAFDAKNMDQERALAKMILHAYGNKLVFPKDVVATSVLSAAHTHVSTLDHLKAQEMTLDVGPQAIESYANVLAGAASVVWNGPLGVIEKTSGEKGTLELAAVLADMKKTRRVIGGGDTITFFARKKMLKAFNVVSTGGGAMLTFLAKKPMPGLNVLET